MSVINIANYVEKNNVPVTSSTAKNVGSIVTVGGGIGGSVDSGTVTADINKQYSAGVFVGEAGHRN